MNISTTHKLYTYLSLGFVADRLLFRSDQTIPLETFFRVQ